MKAILEGVEVEGEPQEIAALIRELKPIVKVHSTSASRSNDSPTKREAPMPTIEQIWSYIKSRPDYAHSTEELTAKLYHREIGPRRSKDEDYVFFYHRTQSARAKIEREEQGKFKLNEENQMYTFSRS